MPFTMEELMSMPKGNGPRPSEAWSKEINADGQIGLGILKLVSLFLIF